MQCPSLELESRDPSLAFFLLVDGTLPSSSPLQQPHVSVPSSSRREGESTQLGDWASLLISFTPNIRIDCETLVLSDCCCWLDAGFSKWGYSPFHACLPLPLLLFLPSLSSFSLLLIRQGDPNPNHIPPSTAEKALSLSAHSLALDQGGLRSKVRPARIDELMEYNENRYVRKIRRGIV